MKKILPSILLLFFFVCGYGQQPGYWQQQVDADIQVVLNDRDHSLNADIKMNYFNNSPDTLRFIWIHLWPNAYKNDRTAFSDQLLENGRTDFYFSNEDQRGYINRLNFKVDDRMANTQDHPQHQDIVKLLLPQPLAPGQSIKIETPFHVKLPEYFSRSGHINQSYQLTQWYPKPAVYDSKGWHTMPYLDQGEFYSEFGNYNVHISLPKNYVVASTGVLKNIIETDSVKTLHYQQNNIHDFAWFADKDFEVLHDTLQLKSKVIDVYAYYHPSGKKYWTNSIRYIKAAIKTKSEWLGEYPYPVVSVVEKPGISDGGGMEYPTITLISKTTDEKMLDFLINHEVGHNWFYGILASNERTHPWMDEGMNSYYDQRYSQLQYGENGLNYFEGNAAFIKKRSPEDIQVTALQTITGIKKDQPIETISEAFSEINYGLIAYSKAAQWMQGLEKELGTPLFDSMMQHYYEKFKFKHPYPADFKATAEAVTGKNLDDYFSLLYTKGSLQKPLKRDLRVTSFFSLKETDKHQYIFVAPAVGYNFYDKFMLGVFLHNYTMPFNKFQFFIAPLYATGSKQVKGIGSFKYRWNFYNVFDKIEIGLNGSSFSKKHSLDSTGKKIFEKFSKIVPFIAFHFKHPYRSSLTSWLDIRAIMINEKQFDNYEYKAGSDSILLYPTTLKRVERLINQLTFTINNRRVLYPYDFQLQLQQGKSFYRINSTAEYFFNYSNGGGVQTRLFMSKFGYIGSKSFDAFLYQPKLLGGNGEDDYTYNNYFLGRTASSAYGNTALKNDGIGSQQIMVQNGGGLKMRLDPYTSVHGSSENWVAAINLSTTLPNNLFPVKLPLKIFFDAGTYSEAWDRNSLTPRISYVGGLQLSLFKNVLNIYAPLLYSKVYRDQLKTDPEANKFIKKITFSIDFKNAELKKLFPQIPF